MTDQEIDKIIRPPIDAAMKNEPHSIQPGSITYVEAGSFLRIFDLFPVRDILDMVPYFWLGQEAESVRVNSVRFE